MAANETLNLNSQNVVLGPLGAFSPATRWSSLPDLIADGNWKPYLYIRSWFAKHHGARMWRNFQWISMNNLFPFKMVAKNNNKLWNSEDWLCDLTRIKVVSFCMIKLEISKFQKFSLSHVLSLEIWPKKFVAVVILLYWKYSCWEVFIYCFEFYECKI